MAWRKITLLRRVLLPHSLLFLFSKWTTAATVSKISRRFNLHPNQQKCCLCVTQQSRPHTQMCYFMVYHSIELWGIKGCISTFLGTYYILCTNLTNVAAVIGRDSQNTSLDAYFFGRSSRLMSNIEAWNRWKSKKKSGRLNTLIEELILSIVILFL